MLCGVSFAQAGPAPPGQQLSPIAAGISADLTSHAASHDFVILHCPNCGAAARIIQGQNLVPNFALEFRGKLWRS
jgi:hypothetical protein